MTFADISWSKNAKFGNGYTWVRIPLNAKTATMSIEKNIAKHQEQIRNMLLNSILPTIDNPFQNLDHWLTEYINRSVQLISRLNQLDNQENSIRVLLEHSKFRAELLNFLNELAGERKTLTSDTCLADYQNALEHLQVHFQNTG